MNQNAEKSLQRELRAAEDEFEIPERLRVDPDYLEKFGLNPESKLSCRIRDCDNDLHCFFARSEKNLVHPRGQCQGCGADLVHWDSAHVADILDPAEKRRIMEAEMLRHYMWHVDFDEKATDYANKFGRSRIRNLLRSRIEKLREPNRPFDGRDVPFKHHPVNYARHATATCCRVCVEYWFGFPKDVKLTDAQIERLYRFANYYIDTRFADIPEIVRTQNTRRSKKQDPKWVP